MRVIIFILFIYRKAIILTFQSQGVKGEYFHDYSYGGKYPVVLVKYFQHYLVALFIRNVAVYLLLVFFICVFISVRSLVPENVVQRTLEQQYDMLHGEPVIQLATGSVFHSRQCKCCSV